MTPLYRKQWARFRSIRHGYYASWAIVLFLVFSLFLECFVNDDALAVRYEGKWYFPVFSQVYAGSTFGLTGAAGQVPVNYRELDAAWEASGSEHFVWMPLIPYGPNENIPYEGVFKPAPPSAQNWLGTDTTGRDILARLLYGLRIAIFFALAFLVSTYLVGITIGCLMGYFGGWTDIVGQRVIEIWSNIPFLYTVIIIFSVIPTTFGLVTRIGILLTIMVLFSWTGMTYYMRTATYKEKARSYVEAAQILGAGTFRVIFRHVLPNALSTVITFIPFTIVGAITSITALDFIGFGLPPPTPSIGELLKQGTANLREAPWIISSAFVALTITLTLFTFVGEAIREAFDPRKQTRYR